MNIQYSNDTIYVNRICEILTNEIIDNKIINKKAAEGYIRGQFDKEGNPHELTNEKIQGVYNALRKNNVEEFIDEIKNQIISIDDLNDEEWEKWKQLYMNLIENADKNFGYVHGYDLQEEKAARRLKKREQRRDQAQETALPKKRMFLKFADHPNYRKEKFDPSIRDEPQTLENFLVDQQDYAKTIHTNLENICSLRGVSKHKLIDKNDKHVDSLMTKLDLAFHNIMNTNFMRKYFRILTLGLYNHQKYNRKQRIESLRIAITSLDNAENDLKILPEELKLVKANLQFLLATAIFAQRPREKELMDEAKRLIDESIQNGSSLALSLKQKDFNFDEFGNFSKEYDHEKAEEGYQEFKKICKESGIRGLIDKNDIHEMFKLRTEESARNAEMRKILKTIFIVLTAPILWPVSVVTFLIGSYFTLGFVMGGLALSGFLDDPSTILII